MKAPGAIVPPLVVTTIGTLGVRRSRGGGAHGKLGGDGAIVLMLIFVEPVAWPPLMTS